MAKQIVNSGAMRNLWDLGAIAVPWEPEPVISIQGGDVNALVNAVMNASWGDVIQLEPGTYNMTTTIGPGAPHVSVVGATNNQSDVIINGPGMDNASYGAAPNAFWCQQPGFSLRNLTIQNFFWHGLTFGNGGVRPFLKNVAILDCGEQFIKASSLPTRVIGGYIGGCRFAFTGPRPTALHGGTLFYGGAIDAHTVGGWIVEDSLFENLAPTGAEVAWGQSAHSGAYQHWWSPAVYFWNRSRNNIVRRCLFINCPRAVAYGLSQLGGGEFDCFGGSIHNNMAIVDAGYMGAEQIADSDGQILAWQSPQTEIYHNTIITNGQIANCIQTRWETAGTIVRRNLSDATVRSRDSSTATIDTNTTNAVSGWFVSPGTGDLRLSASGVINVPQDVRLAGVLDDYYRNTRPTPTHRGAHHPV